MYFPDLRSIDDVEALPMPEFNLRVECLTDRIRWERGLGIEVPQEPMKPVRRGEITQVLAQLMAKESKPDG